MIQRKGTKGKREREREREGGGTEGAHRQTDR